MSSSTPASGAPSLFGNVMNFGRDAMAQLSGRPGSAGTGAKKRVYDQSSESILEKINQDMEVALSAKAGAE